MVWNSDFLWFEVNSLICPCLIDGDYGSGCQVCQSNGIDCCSLNRHSSSYLYYHQMYCNSKIKNKYTFCTALALNSLKHILLLPCILFHSASLCFLPHLCFLLYSHMFLPFHLLPPISFLLPLFSLVYHSLLCHKNELNLSPSVQTTIDRVGTFRKTNRHLLSLLGIGCTVCVSVHVYCWWGWGGRWGTGLCQRGTQGHLLTCHPHSVCWTSKRSRQMMLIIISSPVVMLGGLHSCPCWAPDAQHGRRTVLYVAMQRASNGKFR